MTVTLTESDKKRILETLSVEECEKFIESYMDDIEQIKQNEPEDFFGIIPIRQNDIEYYKLAIKLLEDAMEKAEDVKFDATKEELEIIAKIVVRINQYIKLRDYETVADRMMDIEACHSNGCRLDLKKFLNLDKLSFLHDVAGITKCLDRTTGKLTNGFRPRCAE